MSQNNTHRGPARLAALALTAALVLAGASTVNAAVVFSEDWESYTIPVSPPFAEPSTSVYSYSSTGINAYFPITVDSANYLGLGSTNQVVQMLDTTTVNTSLVKTSVLSGEVATLSFDMRLNTLPSSSSAVTVRFVDSVGDQLYRIRVTPTNGTVTVETGGNTSGSTSNQLTPTLAHTVDLVVNNSASTVLTYLAPDDATIRNLPAQFMDLWIDGVRRVTNPVSTAGVLSGFGFFSNGGGLANMYIDNIFLRNYAYTTGSTLNIDPDAEPETEPQPSAVPTPSAMAMLLICGLGAAVRRRRR